MYFFVYIFPFKSNYKIRAGFWKLKKNRNIE